MEKSEVWMEPCLGCSFRSELGCTCDPTEIWYQCKLQPEPNWDKIMGGNVDGKEKST